MIDDIDAIGRSVSRARDISRFPMATGVGAVGGGEFQALMRDAGGNMQMRPAAFLPQPVLMNAQAARSRHSRNREMDDFARRDRLDKQMAMQLPSIAVHTPTFKSVGFSPDGRPAPMQAVDVLYRMKPAEVHPGAA